MINSLSCYGLLMAQFVFPSNFSSQPEKKSLHLLGRGVVQVSAVGIDFLSIFSSTIDGKRTHELFTDLGGLVNK
jgi:hypothetical protein